MAPFYPYNLLNTTSPCPTHTQNIRASTPLPIEAINSQNSSGTSLSTTAIAGIIIGVLILFGSLTWFVWHALSVLPRRKKAALGERRVKAGRHTDRGTAGDSGGVGMIMWSMLREGKTVEDGGGRFIRTVFGFEIALELWSVGLSPIVSMMLEIEGE
ncbi:hypothetical protein HBI56_162920 [Parastagonospora nodorum]|nr:hypothetical protein HBH56_125200 [Parastagonospora nodorum]KAH3931467.1 hypothetical protein HBH54_098310 [Parastagonospora nodorum]KAH3944313.1 hypothetical protein HBH53_159780 [Parastagonospora nodorum]KAH3956860.1 hypothetical protein HBH51_233510 [Parastagonospora nodorum]KAH3971764.1 hypothetical protein HBH52_154300 [Parastagonospora nodorum]